MDWSVPRKGSHIKRAGNGKRGEPAPIAVRKARAGTVVLGAYRCGVAGCDRAYRYAAVGEIRGACAAPARKGLHPHEYMTCPRHPELAICLTHSPYYRAADAYFRAEGAPDARS